MSDQLFATPPEVDVFEEPVDQLVAEVAGHVGWDNDITGRAKALAALQRAVRRMNIAGVYLFRMKEAVFATGTDFNDGDTTLTLPTDWGWPAERAFAYNEDGRILSNIEWVDFVFLRSRGYNISTHTSAPQLAALRSEFGGHIHLYPAIDADTVETIAVPYYARIDDIATGSDLQLTPEAREALLTGGIAFMIQYRHSTQPAIWAPYFDDFKDALSRAKAASFRRQNNGPLARPDI